MAYYSFVTLFIVSFLLFRYSLHTLVSLSLSAILIFFTSDYSVTSFSFIRHAVSKTKLPLVQICGHGIFTSNCGIIVRNLPLCMYCMYVCLYCIVCMYCIVCLYFFIACSITVSNTTCLITRIMCKKYCLKLAILIIT